MRQAAGAVRCETHALRAPASATIRKGAARLGVLWDLGQCQLVRRHRGRPRSLRLGRRTRRQGKSPQKALRGKRRRPRACAEHRWALERPGSAAAKADGAGRSLRRTAFSRRRAHRAAESVRFHVWRRHAPQESCGAGGLGRQAREILRSRRPASNLEPQAYCYFITHAF